MIRKRKTLDIVTWMMAGPEVQQRTAFYMLDAEGRDMMKKTRAALLEDLADANQQLQILLEQRDTARSMYEDLLASYTELLEEEDDA